MPSLAGATGWLNCPPLTREALRGKVVLVDFWTYSCINCLRTLPYVKRWYDKYKDHGLVVIGVHAPEFAFEQDPDNVRRAVGELGITYPVAIDDDYAIWRGFYNQYWPAHYFIDAAGPHPRASLRRGRLRGLGAASSASCSPQAGYKDLPPAGAAPAAAGIEAAPDMAHVLVRGDLHRLPPRGGFRSPGGFADDRSKSYALPASLALNEWGLLGRWTDDPEKAVLDAAPGKIEFRFLARDLHLVLGPRRRQAGALSGAPGRHCPGRKSRRRHGRRRQRRHPRAAPVSAHSADRPRRAHTFSIEFLDAGAQAYSFTFG